MSKMNSKAIYKERLHLELPGDVACELWKVIQHSLSLSHNDEKHLILFTNSIIQDVSDILEDDKKWGDDTHVTFSLILKWHEYATVKSLLIMVSEGLEDNEDLLEMIDGLIDHMETKIENAKI